MFYEVDGLAPRVDPSADIAPTAVLSGDVTVGPGCSVGFGAVILGERGSVDIGERSIVREQVVIRADGRNPVRVGSNVLIGAHSALYGCSVEDAVFLATGVTIFHGAVIGRRSEVRINGVPVDPMTYL